MAISIHAPRAGSDQFNKLIHNPIRISIHAPRAGSDAPRLSCPLTFTDFNPRSPCGERRASARPRSRLSEFQSTLPVRGATISLPVVDCDREISIHAPRAGSDFFVLRRVAICILISIHAPRAGSDPWLGGELMTDFQFQSTLPVRGATGVEAGGGKPQAISIHAPRAGSDNRQDFYPISVNISIHAPRAGSDRRG